jgi:hypothetical protein
MRNPRFDLNQWKERPKTQAPVAIYGSTRARHSLSWCSTAQVYKLVCVACCALLSSLLSPVYLGGYVTYFVAAAPGCSFGDDDRSDTAFALVAASALA